MSEATERLATEQLIARLAASAGPVRRLRPPVVRAGLWLLAVALVAGPAVLVLADAGATLHRWRDPWMALEMTGALLAGIGGVIAAFELSLPDRSRRWAWLPIPPLALWLGCTGAGCYGHWLQYGAADWELGEGANCFGFILGLGLPLGISLLVLLRRARPLAAAPVAAMGGLGAAAIAAFLLQFFHPFEITFLDLGMHAIAVAIVVATASLVSRLSPRRRAIPT